MGFTSRTCVFSFTARSVSPLSPLVSPEESEAVKEAAGSMQELSLEAKGDAPPSDSSEPSSIPAADD